ncbi:MAG: uncharacterized protein K0S30_1716 [Clostridia bacterium]|jgi:two-component system response regulator YesN|nr:uncharacterized protein [Clostridia bacterium]
MFRLLIADNEYIEREAMKTIVQRKFGELYEIREAANGLQAIEEAKTFLPHVIFMDIKMPFCSGIEAAKKIREFSPEVSIVFITAYDYFDYAKDAIALQAAELLLKPVEMEKVWSLIETLTEKMIKAEKWQYQNKELEFKFEQITRGFQLEFMKSLKNYNTSLESIEQYLKVMDISFVCAMAVTLDFTTITQYKTSGIIEKNFMRTRFLDKVSRQSEKKGILCIIGAVDDCMQLLFLESRRGQNDHESMREATILVEVQDMMDEAMAQMHMKVDYTRSELIKEPSHLPMALYLSEQTQLDKQGAGQNGYPYELEEQLIAALEKHHFEEARGHIVQIAKVLRRLYSGNAFNREARGLYAIVKRTLRRFSEDVMMPYADQLSERIFQDVDMVSFFQRFFSYAEDIIENRKDKNQVLIQKIKDYLEAHYREDISLKQAAEMIGFSSFYFSKLMKEYLNTSYVEYLASVRMRKARDLLETTDKTISEIGYEVGYADANYFTRAFKRIEGMTPTEYKANHFKG